MLSRLRLPFRSSLNVLFSRRRLYNAGESTTESYAALRGDGDLGGDDVQLLVVSERFLCNESTCNMERAQLQSNRGGVSGFVLQYAT